MSSKLIKMIKDLTLNTYTLLPKCLLQEKQPCVVFVWQRHLTGAFVQQQIKLHSVFTRDEFTAGGTMGYLHIKNALV